MNITTSRIEAAQQSRDGVMWTSRKGAQQPDRTPCAAKYWHGWRVVLLTDPGAGLPVDGSSVEALMGAWS